MSTGCWKGTPGGQYLFSDLSNPTLQTVLAAIGVIVLLPLDLLPCPHRRGTPAGLRQRSPTLGRRHRPRASGRRSRRRYRPDPVQPLNHILLGWRHLQLAPVCPFSLGLRRPRVGNPDGRRRPDDLVHRTDRRRSLHPPPHRPDLLPPRQLHPRPYPPWLRHVLCNSPVPPFTALKRDTEIRGTVANGPIDGRNHVHTRTAIVAEYLSMNAFFIRPIKGFLDRGC